MKKLLLIFFSLMLSCNSYGEWTELPASNSEEQGFIDFDNLQERGDGYVYWWMMTSYSNRSEKLYIQTDCQAGRIKPLQEDYHSEPMGVGDSTLSVESDIGWYYPAPDTGIYRFVEVACEMAKQNPEERERSVANLLMELEYKNKINKLSEEGLASEQQNEDLFELEIAELKLEQERIQYNRILAQAIQDEQDTTRSIIIEDQLNSLKSAYVIQIASKVKALWRYQAAEKDWTAEVYVIQDRNGNVQAVDVRSANVGNSSLAKSFMDSIERAVYKASPLPAAPDDAVFDREIYMLFSVN
jgi:hypothetical protein